MDSDRTIQKFKRYSAKYSVTLGMMIVAGDMTEAVDRFEYLFHGYLFNTSYQDILTIERGAINKEVYHERTYFFKVLIEVDIETEGEVDDQTEDEAREKLARELDDEHPYWVVRADIFSMELKETEFLGEDYRD